MKHNLFSMAQYGFCKRRSTTNLPEDFNYLICSEIDKSNLVLTRFVDLKKAFDPSDHKILFTNMKASDLEALT